ncbi:hypothetical protein Tco_0575769 [Tanacetum coccineum]
MCLRRIHDVGEEKLDTETAIYLRTLMSHADEWIPTKTRRRRRKRKALGGLRGRKRSKNAVNNFESSEDDEGGDKGVERRGDLMGSRGKLSKQAMIVAKSRQLNYSELKDQSDKRNKIESMLAGSPRSKNLVNSMVLLGNKKNQPQEKYSKTCKNILDDVLADIQGILSRLTVHMFLIIFRYTLDVKGPYIDDKFGQSQMVAL